MLFAGNNAVPAPGEEEKLLINNILLTAPEIPLIPIISDDDSSLFSGIISTIYDYLNKIEAYKSGIMSKIINMKDLVSTIQTALLRRIPNEELNKIVRTLYANLSNLIIADEKALRSMNLQFKELKKRYETFISTKEQYENQDAKEKATDAEIKKIKQAEAKGGNNYVGGYLDDNTPMYIPSMIATSGGILGIGLMALFVFCVILLIYCMAKYIYTTQFKSELRYNDIANKYHGRRRTSMGLD